MVREKLSCVEVAVCKLSEHVILVFVNVYLTSMNYEQFDVTNIVSGTIFLACENQVVYLCFLRPLFFEFKFITSAPWSKKKNDYPTIVQYRM